MNPDIAFVLPAFSGGGAERVAMNLASGLAASNRKVVIIVFNSSGALSSLVPDGIELIILDTKRLRSSVLKLIKTFWKLKPKIIFSTHGYINLALLLSRFFLPSGIQLWIREANLPSLSLPNSIFPVLTKVGYLFLYKTADKFFATSRRMMSEMVDLFSVPINKQVILPNPVDVGTIRRLMTAECNLPEAETIFVAAGRMTRQKGFDRLLRIFGNTVFAKSVLVFLGTGVLQAELEAQCRDLRLQDRVIFAGFQKNPWKYIARANAFLLPSRWEGMPNIVLESLACGTMVIVTPESGGVEEVAASAPSGAVVVADINVEFKKAMINVLNKKRTSNYNFLPKKFCLEGVVSQFVAIMGNNCGN